MCRKERERMEIIQDMKQTKDIEYTLAYKKMTRTPDTPRDDFIMNFSVKRENILKTISKPGERKNLNEFM